MNTPTVEPADERLAGAVRDSLWRSEPIRALDRNSLQVEARGGIVTLRGLVASEAHRSAAGQLARNVVGVKDVVNELLTDEGLERRIASALAADPVARGHRIAVNVVRGVASLYGAVTSAEEAEALRQLAQGVPGVVVAESRLQVVPAGSRVVLTWQNSVEGRPLPPEVSDSQREDSLHPGESTITRTAAEGPSESPAEGTA